MQRAIEMMEKWKPLCDKYKCSISNLALAWIMGQGDYITVLNGCSKIQQIEENIKADEVCLTKSDREWMQNLAEEIQ
jgi:methylglyoxal reductase